MAFIRALADLRQSKGIINLMLELTPDNFMPLSSSHLYWRWSDPRWGKLPDEVLSQIHALNISSSQSLWPVAQQCIRHFDNYISAGGMLKQGNTNNDSIKSIIVQHKTPIDVGIELHALQPEPRCSIVALWEPDTGIVLPWNLFCHYWAQFCYPSSDDLFLIPIALTWCLLYHNEDVFLFHQHP